MAWGQVSTPWRVGTNRLANQSVTKAKLHPSIVPTEGATFVVAASNSKSTSRADYICTGTNDQTTINTALNALPSGGGSVQLMEGTFNIGASIVVPDDNVMIFGSGAGTVIQTSSNVIMIDVNFVQVTISNLKIVGAGAGNAANVGIEFDNATASRVVGCHIGGTGSYAIRMVNAGEIIVANNHIYTCQGDCVRIDAGSGDCIIDGNVILSPDSTNLVYLGSSGNSVTGNHIETGTNGVNIQANANEVTSNTLITLTLGVNVNRDYNSVTGNMASICTDGIFITSTGNYNTVTGNSCFNCTDGIHVAGDDNNITGNACNDNTNYGIHNNSSDRCTISGNICNSNTFDGIFVYTAFYCAVSSNDASANSRNGINMEMSAYTAVTGNSCGQNVRNGIFVDGSSHNSITGNTCYNNDVNNTSTYDGINAGPNADNNIISSNRCGGNDRDGIRINNANCDKNIVIGNQCLNNTGAALTDNGTNTEQGHNIVV